MTPPKDSKELRETLAAIEHQRWSDWQKYIHSLFLEHSNGEGKYVCLSVEWFNRWERQIATPYSELSEKEKDGDREQVDRYWPFVEAYAKEFGRQEQPLKPDKGVTCPYCGWLHPEKEVWSNQNRKSDFSDNEWWCDNCGKEFLISATVIGCWFTSEPVENPKLNLSFQNGEKKPGWLTHLSQTVTKEGK